tara:strand:+ start:346 stop:864 length:519 start_codon:yes stop_codon:yes gene_type:complete
MSIKFRIGDNVILKKERTKAIVILVIGDKKLKVEDEYGFKYILNSSDILPLNTSTDNMISYGTNFVIKDEEITKEKKKMSFSKTDSRGQVKIDLHIDKITSNYDMKNSEIIKIQMDFCKKELDQAMIKQKHSLEIIHGIGGGVLKAEVHKLLNLYNLTFFESNNGGSTVVIL